MGVSKGDLRRVSCVMYVRYLDSKPAPSIDNPNNDAETNASCRERSFILISHPSTRNGALYSHIHIPHPVCTKTSPHTRHFFQNHCFISILNLITKSSHINIALLYNKILILLSAAAIIVTEDTLGYIYMSGAGMAGAGIPHIYIC